MFFTPHHLHLERTSECRAICDAQRRGCHQRCGAADIGVNPDCDNVTFTDLKLLSTCVQASALQSVMPEKGIPYVGLLACLVQACTRCIPHGPSWQLRMKVPAAVNDTEPCSTCSL